METIKVHITVYEEVKNGRTSIIKYGSDVHSDVDDTIAISHDFAILGEEIVKKVTARNDYYDNDKHMFTSLSF